MQNGYIVLVNIFLLLFLLIFRVARSAKAFDYEVIYNSWKENLLYKRDRLEKQLNEVEKEVKKLNSGKVIKVENIRNVIKYSECSKSDKYN